MRQDNLPDCIRLLRLMRAPHPVACLARQAERCEKSTRRDIARLRGIGFRVVGKRLSEWGPKSYQAVDPIRDFQRIVKK